MNDYGWHAFMELTVAHESLRLRARALAMAYLRLLERGQCLSGEEEGQRRAVLALLADLQDGEVAERARRPEVDVAEVVETVDCSPGRGANSPST